MSLEIKAKPGTEAGSRRRRFTVAGTVSGRLNRIKTIKSPKHLEESSFCFLCSHGFINVPPDVAPPRFVLVSLSLERKISIRKTFNFLLELGLGYRSNGASVRRNSWNFRRCRRREIPLGSASKELPGTRLECAAVPRVLRHTEKRAIPGDGEFLELGRYSRHCQRPWKTLKGSREVQSLSRLVVVNSFNRVFITYLVHGMMRRVGVGGVGRGKKERQDLVFLFFSFVFFGLDRR